MSSSPKILELEGTGDHADRLKNSNMNTNAHVTPGDAAQTTPREPTTLHSPVPLIWSSASATAVTSASEETYIQGVSALNNGGLPFQQFPASLSMDSTQAMYQSNPASSSLVSQQGRRAITGHSSVNSFPRQQATHMMNTCSIPKMLPNWNNSQQASWSPQQPQTSLYPPWNVQQRRSVPNVNVVAPAVAVKKQTVQQQLQHSYFISPTKFRRSTSFPGQIQAAVGVKNPYDFTAFDDVTYQVILLNFINQGFKNNTR